MSSRKAVPTLSPAGVRPMKTAFSAEYIEALQVLNESTLNTACDLLLDDSNLDTERLLEMYQKCENALKVVQKQQPANASNLAASLPPGPPNLSAPGLRAPAPRTTLPKLANKIATQGVMPMRRTAMTKPGRVTRERSESDLDLQGNNKKARHSPPLVDNPKAPPPSARNFLAKLNKESNNNTAPASTANGPPRKPSRVLHRRSSA